MAYETKLPRQASSSTVTEDFSEDSEVPPPACSCSCSAGHGASHSALSCPPAHHLLFNPTCNSYTQLFYCISATFVDLRERERACRKNLELSFRLSRLNSRFLKFSPGFEVLLNA